MQFLRFVLLILATLNFSLNASWAAAEGNRTMTRQRCEERYTGIVNSAIAVALYAHRGLQPGKKFVLRPKQSDNSFVSWFERQITGYLGFVYDEHDPAHGPMRAIPPLHPRDYWTMGWMPEGEEVRQLVEARRQADVDQKKACADEALQSYLLKDLRTLVAAYFVALEPGISVQDLLDLGWPRQPRALQDQNTKDTLQLYGFGLTSLRGLQASEAEMKTIKCIDLRCNDFESLEGEDEAILAQFKNLKRILLDGNKKLRVIGKLFRSIPSLQVVMTEGCTQLLKASTEKGWPHFELDFGGQYDYIGMSNGWKRDLQAEATDAMRQDAEQDQKRRGAHPSIEEDLLSDFDRYLDPRQNQRPDNNGEVEEFK